MNDNKLDENRLNNLALDKKQFKILSYNIWFDEYERTERLFSLFENIKYENPDVVCFQEVLNFQYDTIKDRLNYEYCFPESFTDGYSCVILSKIPITKTKILKLPSRMARSLELALIKVQNIEIVVANIHFESEFKNGLSKSEINTNKISQYKYVSTILKKVLRNHKNIILCSDTNVMVHEEDTFDRLFNFAYDAWVMSGKSKKKEFTYDFQTNQNLKSRNIRIQRRIDKILFRSNDQIKLSDFNLVRGIFGKIQPSDHHGISAVFDICQ